MSQSNVISPAPRRRFPSAAIAAALAGVTGLIALSGCTVMPTGPSVMALPGTGKSFDQFRADDASCRQFALQQVGGVSAGQGATASALGSAAIGTALGAAAGAAFNGGRGAAVGAGAGLLAGSVIGAGNAQGSDYGIQRRYDYAYMQCMYAAGERVPMPRGAVRSYEQQEGDAPPPPPPGEPPQSPYDTQDDAPPPPPPPPGY
ncbi:MAG: hypothetical protein QOI13_2651 [Paraburkholderia sp.]|jgi:hypothetical protein|nr:hypothetical protein [Paraburkholderia sp.]